MTYATKEEVLSAVLAKTLSTEDAIAALESLEKSKLVRSLRIEGNPDKGTVKVYGINARMPVVMYPPQWIALLSIADQIRAFIDKHHEHLSMEKGKPFTRAPQELIGEGKPFTVSKEQTGFAKATAPASPAIAPVVPTTVDTSKTGWSPDVESLHRRAAESKGQDWASYVAAWMLTNGKS